MNEDFKQWSNGQGGLMSDPVLGNITVYREFKPKRDSVEYTVFFRKEDNRCPCCGDNPKLRLDMEVSVKDLESMSEPENTMRYRIYKEIINGRYRKATEAVQ